jgi:NADPH:quinone reductase-like Zn-dependent oxidoreductase
MPEGAFQHYVVLMQHMVSPIPDSLPSEQAAVLPLTLSTAATGMFQQDHLGLAMPSADPVDRPETVLVWGGSTSVGSNAIQLARNAGYQVVTTASPHNFDYVRALGAADAVDYHSPTVVDEIVDRIGDRPLAGTLAIGSGSLPRAVAIASRTTGSKRVASAQPGPLTRIRSGRALRLGVRVSAIWGGTLKDNEVGPAIYVDFLPTALATGAYRAAPDATVVGDGLASIPDALQELRRGVSAKKLVVTV